MLSPTAASVSFSSSGGSLWLNSTWGAVWLARRPSLNSCGDKNAYNEPEPSQVAPSPQGWQPPRTCMKTLPMMTSSSSLNTVLKTTVTLSFLASTYLRVPISKRLGWEYDPKRLLQAPPRHSHGLVVSVVDHGPLLALLALLLELEVLFEHGGKTVPLEHARLVDDLVFVGRQRVQVVEEGDVVAWQETFGRLGELYRIASYRFKIYEASNHNMTDSGNGVHEMRNNTWAS